MPLNKKYLTLPPFVEPLETRTLLSSEWPALNYAFVFKAPAIILPGSKQTAKLEIKNTGSSLIETNLPITVYVADAPTLDADSKQQTILTIDPALRLMGGKSKNITIHFTMPATFVTGTCYVLASVDQQVFSTSAMYNPSGGYASGTYGNAPATASDATEYLDTGTWTANGQTNTFSINIRSIADGTIYADVLASGNFGQISMSDLPAHITPQGKFSLHAANVAATIFPPGSTSNSGSNNNNNSNSGGSDSGGSDNGSNNSGGSDSGGSDSGSTGSSGGTDSGTSGGSSASGGTEQVNFSIAGLINSGQIDGGINLKSIKPAASTGTTGTQTGEQSAAQSSGSSTNYTQITNSGSFDVAPPAQSVGGTAPAIVVDMDQLPAQTSSNITLTGEYPDHSYVGTISVTLTRKLSDTQDGISPPPFTTYTVNTVAGTWAVPISIAGVPDGVYTVNATDTNTGGTSLAPDSGGSLTISTIGANVHFSTSQLPLVTNTNQTLTGTYDSVDADGGQITRITICLTDATGKQTFFPATLGGGTWSAPISTTGLTDGAYTVTATATDAKGNTGTAAAPGTFTIDTLVNTLGSDIQFPAGVWMATPTTPYTLMGTFTNPDTQTGPDGTTDSIIAIIINLADSKGDTQSFPAILSGGIWSALINVSNLTAGTYTVTATVFDSNGSTGTAPAPSTFTVLGVDPEEMRGAYGLEQNGSNLINFNGVQGDGSGETIAIVDAYDDPNAQSDLEAFDQQFGLPDPPSFEKLDQTGQPVTTTNTVPTDPAGSWESEESLDIEWAHAMAPGANIILFEADPASNSIADQAAALTTAAQAAANTAGIDVVSMSWGMAESLVPNETQYDPIFATPGITFVASTGDHGASSQQTNDVSVEYPAASLNVVAVGGTVLTTNDDTYSGETAWSGSGGGVSVYESQPSYQTGVVPQDMSTGQRTVPDVSMDAALNTGVPIYDSSDNPTNPWFIDPDGGTSLAAPMFAGIVAIADQGRASNGMGSLSSAQTLQKLYSAGTSAFHDVTSGSNGYYSAGTGYDLVTGLGSPVANLLIPKLAGVPISLASPSVVVNSTGGNIANSDSTAFALALNANAVSTYNGGINATTNGPSNSIFSTLPIADAGASESSII